MCILSSVVITLVIFTVIIFNPQTSRGMMMMEWGKERGEPGITVKWRVV